MNRMYAARDMNEIHYVAGFCGDETRRHVYDVVPQIDVVAVARDIGDAIYATFYHDSHAVD